MKVGRKKGGESAKKSFHENQHDERNNTKGKSRVKVRLNFEGISSDLDENSSMEDQLLLSPKSSLQELVEGSKMKTQFSEWLSVMKTGGTSVTLPETEHHENGEVFTENTSPKLQLSMADVIYEIE